MKRAIILAVSIALMAGVGTASAKTSKTKQKGAYASQGRFTQQRVKLQSSIPPPNADLKYGPQPDYPQSPPGGGY